ncbi:MAG: signal transduction histidine kinase [Paraglaciecola sp.]|jgi:signal transduction histidine kinase
MMQRKNFFSKIQKLGRVEDFEVKNNRLILFLIGPTMFVYSYYIQNNDDESIKIKGAKVIFALLFLVASFCPFIFKKTIHYFYGWIVFLLMLSFTHYLLIHLSLNSFHVRFILGFYAVVFGSILLFNKTTFINIYLLTIFIHLFQKLMISEIDYSSYKAVLGSFTLIVVFAIILLNDSTAYKSSLANKNRALEQSRIELKKRAEDLEDKNKDLEEFSNVVSHDLRTPLGNLSALFNWLQKEIEEENKEHIDEHLKLIERETHQMDLILKGVLKYSLQNEARSTGEKLNLDYLLNDIKRFNENENCKIIIKKVLPIVEINKSQIFQVFQNLIQNSINYNDKEVCKIEVDYTQDNEFYTFSVKDNGIGIAKKYHKKIFKLFQRLDFEETRDSMGIGLSMAKKIINRNKGEIYLESQVGIGSTFYFTLPV